jgi:hypothetical protein
MNTQSWFFLVLIIFAVSVFVNILTSPKDQEILAGSKEFWNSVSCVTAIVSGLAINYMLLRFIGNIKAVKHLTHYFVFKIN